MFGIRLLPITNPVCFKHIQVCRQILIYITLIDRRLNYLLTVADCIFSTSPITILIILHNHFKGQLNSGFASTKVVIEKHVLLLILY